MMYSFTENISRETIRNYQSNQEKNFAILTDWVHIILTWVLSVKRLASLFTHSAKPGYISVVVANATALLSDPPCQKPDVHSILHTIPYV